MRKSLHALFKPTSIPAKPTKPKSKPSSSPKKTTSCTQTKPQTKPNRIPTATHFISLIHSSKTTKQLKQIHTQIIRHNLHANSQIMTQFISSCFLHKNVNYSLLVFRKFDDPNLFIFNVLIRGMVENGFYMSSICYFVSMLRLDIRPSRLTFPFMMKSIVALCENGLCGVIHCQILKTGLEFDPFVRVSLVDMYVKLQQLDNALKLFDESPKRNKLESVLLWNVMINGCCKARKLKKAVELFQVMPDRNPNSWSTLIDGLMRNGEVAQATGIFNHMPEKDVVSWTTMVNGFLHNGKPEKALEMFSRMLEEGMRPNDLTIVSALSACAKTGALMAGVRIHNYILRNGFKLSSAIGTVLVDMYAKCGTVDFASRVFGESKKKDIRTWSVMIWGWALHGYFEKALQCFDKMKSAGIKPDGVVFLAVLTACSHSGRVDQGLHFFEKMRRNYSIEPTMKHYALIVDLYCRAGRLDEALSFVQRMPLEPDLVIWGALFCACRAHKNIEMAELVLGKILHLEPKHPESYIFLSDIYAGAGRWEDVERLRVSMKYNGIDKDRVCSFMEVDGRLHSFLAGNLAHGCAEETYRKLEEIKRSARERGFIPVTEGVLHSVEMEEKENALGNHSEMLALAFGLISTARGTAIRIVKNLRVCRDSHSLMKYASKTSQREIVLRDIKCFHHFKDGTCSCQDYW